MSWFTIPAPSCLSFAVPLLQLDGFAKDFTGFRLACSLPSLLNSNSGRKTV
jgi:hypothetical protein